MSTPLADRIRAQSKRNTMRDTATTGATEALSSQAEVSRTGKAAPIAPSGQSNIAESMGAAQVEADAQVVDDNLQDAAETMAVKEKASDVKQAGIESDRAMRKLEADNKFRNDLANMTSKVQMAQTKHDRDLLAFDLREFIRNKNLQNDQYRHAIESVGERNRLESKEDFAKALSSQGLERGKISTEAAAELQKFKEDYARDNNTKASMNTIAAALEKSEADAAAAAQGAMVGGVTSAAKTGLNMYNTKDKSGWGWGGSSPGDTNVGEGTVKKPKAGPQDDPLKSISKLGYLD